VTDTSTRRPAHDTASRWERHSPLQTAAELSLGLSFTATVAFGGYSAATGHLAVVSQVAGVVFLLTLTCVLVSWFRAVEREDAPAARRTRTTPTAARRATVDATPTTAPASAPAAATATATSFADIAAIDAEYRR
jgi:hypothetical protein